jgi:hypothetical protein
MKPTVKTIKKMATPRVSNPVNCLAKTIHGNKKAISISKTINKIATT